MSINWRNVFAAPRVRLLADRAAPGGADATRQAELDVSGLLCGL